MDHIMPFEIGGEGSEAGLRIGARDRGGARPSDAWSKVDKLCYEKGKSRHIALRKQLSSLAMKKGEKVQEYWGRAEKMRRELRACGGHVDDEEWLWLILSGFHLIGVSLSHQSTQQL